MAAIKAKTLVIIKPGAVQNKHSGEIINLIEKAKFKILHMKKMCLSKEDAQKFYDIHAGKPFFNELVGSMSLKPVIVMVLEKENGIQDFIGMVGATNPAESATGTLRNMFGTSHTENALHRSDAPQTAEAEIKFFFPECEV
jgi:nucleoside-diphosphate kinase